MKIVVKLLSVFIVAGTITTACFYDKLPEMEPVVCDEVSYAAEIQPIWTASCATGLCHDGTTNPELTSGVSYDNLINGGYINVDDPEQSNLYKYLTIPQIIMPPGGTGLPQQQIDLILCWIEQGAPNN